MEGLFTVLTVVDPWVLLVHTTIRKNYICIMNAGIVIILYLKIKSWNRLNLKQKDIFDGYMNDELSRTDYTSTVSMISAKKKPLIKSIKRLEKIQENEWLSKFTTTNSTNRFLLIHKSIEYISWDFEENQIAEIKFISN